MKTQLELVKRINAASSLTTFKIQKYDQNEPKFNGVYFCSSNILTDTTAIFSY